MFITVLRTVMRELLEKQKDIYRTMEFKNPYENFENVYEDMTNQYTNLENTYEDLTVNTQQAEFERGMAQQSQANIMQGLRGVAGSSGVAGLAQSMANIGSQQAQRASASIGQQESRNQAMTARGAMAIQSAERGGDQWVQQANMDRQSTLLGMQMGMTTGANQGFQQAQANQMQAGIAQQQNLANITGTIGKAAGSGEHNIFSPEAWGK